MKTNLFLAKALAILVVGGAMLLPASASAAPIQRDRGEHGQVHKDSRPVEKQFRNDDRGRDNDRRGDNDRFKFEEKRREETRQRDRRNDRSNDNCRPNNRGR